MGVTIRDVARAAGVSTATVSRALSGSRRVSPEVERAVVAASEQLGYRANIVARSLRTQSTQTVGMLVPRISNPFFPAIVEVVEQQLSAAGRQLFLCDSRGSVELEAARLGALIDRQVDGILVVPCHRAASAAAVGRASRRVPLVQVDRFVDGVDGDYVGADNDVGMTCVIEHLRSRGCTSFAFVSALERETASCVRADTYRREVAKVDPASADRLLLGDFSLEWGRLAAERILRERSLPHAVVCGADIVALGVVAALREAGVRIPDDVLVTGYDDIGFAAICSPPLTTIRQPTERIGAEAVELLEARLGGADGPPRHRVLQPELVVRASTADGGSPPSGNGAVVDAG